MGQVVVQKLKKEFKDRLEKAEMYFSLISTLNKLKLAKREIQLLAFTALRGTITPISARKEFVELYDSSLNTLENIKGILVKKSLLVKDGKNGMYKVRPGLDIDFNNDIVLNIGISNLEEKLKEDEGK